MTRAAALIVLAATIVVAALLLLGGGESQTLLVRFTDAGQLVAGGRAEVAGRKVGSIEAVRTTADGLAEVELSIDDDGLLPLREGTRARIRAVGQAGLSNRFVELSPGTADQPPLPDRAVLGTEQTAGIVNLDAIIASFGADDARADLQELIGSTAQAYAGSAAPRFNRLLGRLSPALAEVDALTADVVRDRVALRRLIDTGATASAALAARPDELERAVVETGRWLDGVAAERGALNAALRRAPGVLTRARGTLARAGDTAEALRPALRAVPAAARPLAGVLRAAEQALPPAAGAAAQLHGQLPAIDASLTGVRRLAPGFTQTLRTTGAALNDLLPMLGAFRRYGSDFIVGALSAIGGLSVAPIAEVGHLGKVNLVQSPQTLPGGTLAGLLKDQPLAPGVLGVRSGVKRRCPGGNVPPAPDGSSPWLLGPEFCDASANTPAEVNDP